MNTYGVRGVRLMALALGVGLVFPAFSYAESTPEKVEAAKVEKECACDHPKGEHPADCQCQACDCSKGGECAHGKCATGHDHGAAKPKKGVAKAKSAKKKVEAPAKEAP